MAKCVKCGRELPLLKFGKLRNVCKWCVQYEAIQKGEPVADDERQAVMPVPWARGTTFPMGVTQVIAGICAAVFVGMALATNGESITGPTTAQLIHWGANFAPLTLSGQWWRLLTCMFLHIGILHIALNMWCLWNLGEMAESLYGHTTFAAVYLVSGLGASVVSAAVHPATVSAGASGAIFGVAGALIASLKLGKFSAPGAAVKGTLSSVLTFAAYNLIFGAMNGHTDNAAHIGGLVTGIVLGALIAVMAAERDRPLPRITAVVIVLLAVVCGAGWLQHTRGYVGHVQKAEQLLEQNKPDQAIAELGTAIKQQPEDARAHYDLAHAYSLKGRLADEEAELKRALELQPNSHYVAYQLGILYLNQQRTAEARQIFAQMIASDHQSADGHLGLGLVLASGNEHEAAIQQFQDALQLDPETSGVYYNMGKSYAKLNKLDDAIAAYRKALDTDGEDYDTELALATAYQAKGMHQEALAARSKAEQVKTGHE